MLLPHMLLKLFLAAIWFPKTLLTSKDKAEVLSHKSDGLAQTELTFSASYWLQA